MLKPSHSEPKEWFYGYILLPYGEYYAKTKPFASAKKGDTLRFFNGGDFVIENVCLIKQDQVCDLLCKIRYGIPWASALKRWQYYAQLDGNGRDVISKELCYLVVYGKKKDGEVSD